MSSYIINVKNTSDDEGTVIADVGFSYSDNLNDINDAQLKISGTGEIKRGLFEIGSEVKIYRNGTLGFHGIINGISYLDGGGISADILGYESWLAKENGAYASSPYSATASATIAGHIIGESTYFTAGTVQAGANIDFRIEPTDSLYNALSRLVKRVGQDIGIDYTNSEVDILDHKGSLTSVATLNDGVQIGDMVVRKSYPIGNDVRVFGKSEGETRIKSNPATYGQNQDSKDTYGIIRKDYIDNSITSAGEANALADQLVAKWKDPVKIYEFDVLNPNITLECGDVITLNSSTKGLSDEEVRIVGLKRGVDASREFLTIEVTNKEYSTKTRNINQKIAEIENQSKNLQTYDSYQEEYTNQIDTTTSIGGVIDVYPSYFDMGGYILYDVGSYYGAEEGNMWLQTDGNGHIYIHPGGSGNIYFEPTTGNIYCGNNKIQTLGAPAVDTDAATKKYVDDNIPSAGTQYWSCAGGLFHPGYSTDAYYISNLTYRSTGTDQDAYVSVNLPHGAVVTNVIVYGSENTYPWSLLRNPIDGDWLTGASIMATADINTADSTISNATIDNNNYSYVIHVILNDQYDMIDGARIIYTL